MKFNIFYNHGYPGGVSERKKVRIYTFYYKNLHFFQRI